jgi:hypothetical protein
MRRILLATLFFAAISLVPATADAGSFTISLDYVFSGSTPNSLSPYLTATFADGTDCNPDCGANTVQLTLTGSLENANEFVTEWDFNSSVLPLTITQTSGPVPTSIKTESNAFKADGDGLYDIEILFGSANANRFNNSDVAVFTIVGPTGGSINIATFNQLSSGSTGSGGPFRSAAHIQGITPNGCSGWVGDSASNTNGTGQTGPCGTTVPDGGTTLTFLGLALGGIGAIRRYMSI